MADSPAFAWVCQELEQSTRLDRLEARGTVRLALKAAGLEAAAVLPDQLRVVIERLLPGELEARGVAGAAEICARLACEIDRVDRGQTAEAPDEIFRRLGGG